MKAFNRVLVTVLVLIAAIFAAVNIWLAQAGPAVGRQHRVDASRAAAVIAKDGLRSLELEAYPTLAAVTLIDPAATQALTGERYDYLIKEIDGDLYRFDYVSAPGLSGSLTAGVNIAIGLMTLTVAAVLVYLRVRLLKPFFTLRDMPYELSRGNLTMPLKENKQRFFGRFIWGMDMLRERLEQNKQQELALQAEKKKLVLSLSHDIKIPLSAIKLYCKAISKGLYEQERQTEIAEKINEKADEIESFVSRIVTASREDFLSLEVNCGEFYLSELIGRITAYYADKLGVLGIDFSAAQYQNCLIKGDCDRAVEVIQNIVENAVKYGDGRKISISITEEEGCRLVTVTNTGCTLPPGELPHMFDSFWRGSNSTLEGGSGLGLYICRCLMKKMNGEVFASAHDGKMSVTAVFSPA